MKDAWLSIALALLSFFLSAAFTIAVAYWTRKREYSGAKLLVASEIDMNSTMLHILVGVLDIPPKERPAHAIDFDRTITYSPQWQRSQWEKAPPGAFTTDQLYRIVDW